MVDASKFEEVVERPDGVRFARDAAASCIWQWHPDEEVWSGVPLTVAETEPLWGQVRFSPVVEPDDSGRDTRVDMRVTVLEALLGKDT